MSTGTPKSNRQARRAWAAAMRKNVSHDAPQTLIVNIRHEDGCGIRGPGHRCDCNPERVLLDAKGRVLARVEGAGPYDPFEDLISSARGLKK